MITTSIRHFLTRVGKLATGRHGGAIFPEIEPDRSRHGTEAHGADDILDHLGTAPSATN
jgi:hypothetical protein